MKKLQIMSDLHLENYTAINYDDFISVSGDYLCLLGDIGYPEKKLYQDFIK